MALIQTQNVSNVASVVFTSGITNANQNYRLMFDSVRCPAGSATNFLIVQLSSDGGSTYKTTGYITYLGGGATSGFPMALLNDSAIDFESSGFINLMNMTSGSLAIQSEGLTTAVFVSVMNPIITGQTTHGFYNGTPFVCDAIRVRSVDGNNISGNFYLYGY